MQVRNQGDWPERSLTYLCRAYDHLGKGTEYTEIKTTIHIGILEFPPIPENPQFYAKCMLMDSITHKIYSSKMALYVLDLSQIDTLNEEQKKSKLYDWAKLFKATSWEEIRMLAKKDEAIQETVFTLL